jgi:hypothetical protein
MKDFFSTPNGLTEHLTDFNFTIPFGPFDGIIEPACRASVSKDGKLCCYFMEQEAAKNAPFNVYEGKGFRIFSRRRATPDGEPI